MLNATLRSTPAFAVGGVVPAFACICCGEETLGHHFLDVRSVCPKHCPDHDYQYDRYERRHICVHCDQEADADWYYIED